MLWRNFDPLFEAIISSETLKYPLKTHDTDYSVLSSSVVRNILDMAISSIAEKVNNTVLANNEKKNRLINSK